MADVVRAMMDLIASEVCDKTLELSQYRLSEEELDRLYKISKGHDLVHLVGEALIRNDLIQNAETKRKFRRQIMIAAYRFEKTDTELRDLRRTLDRARIPFVPLKGSITRQYYPEPWMRTCCDIDILVHENDLDSAVELVSKELSYQYDKKGPHDVAMNAKSRVHVELHYDLIEEGRAEKMAPVLKTVWEHATALGDTSEYVLSDEMFYYYHIAHTASHFVTGGCGIRPILDIWVLNHRVSFDREKRNALLAQGDLLLFAEEMERLSEVWFGEGEHTDMTRKVERFLLSGGTYGTVENRISVQQVKKGGKLRYALERIWMPYERLVTTYPSLNGRKWLLPLYELRRWCRLVFCGGLKRGARELQLNSSVTKGRQENLKNMLTGLHLDQ